LFSPSATDDEPYQTLFIEKEITFLVKLKLPGIHIGYSLAVYSWNSHPEVVQ